MNKQDNREKHSQDIKCQDDLNNIRNLSSFLLQLSAQEIIFLEALVASIVGNFLTNEEASILGNFFQAFGNHIQIFSSRQDLLKSACEGSLALWEAQKEKSESKKE